MDRVPLIVGNLGVERLMKLHVGESPPAVGCHRDELREVRQRGADAAEDYLAWAVLEPREGAWDWSFQRENAAQCKALGLRYVVYPWVHIVPDWWWASRGGEGFRCLEHGERCGWPSVFDPATLAAYDHVYAELARGLGDVIDSVCVALPADYGEVGFPTGWGDWVAPLPAGRNHLHPGFWAGDDRARQAWRVSHPSAPPLPERCGPHGPFEDGDVRSAFAAWYLGAMTTFAGEALRVARRHFPTTPLWLKVGHGGEPLAYGIDPTGLARVAAEHGAGIRSTQSSLPDVHLVRSATPCHLLSVPFATEPPVDIGREAATRRVFGDASVGTQEWFAFPEHLVGMEDVLDQARSHLRGDVPVHEVAVLFASEDHRRHATQGFPSALLELAEAMRERAPFAVVDEELLDVLATSGDGHIESPYTVWVVPEGASLRPSSWSALGRLAEGGASIVLGPDVHVSDAATDGVGAIWLRDAPDADAVVLFAPHPAPVTRVRLGGPVDRLHLSGSWHRREDAAQFRDVYPTGESCRWTGGHAAVHVPVDPTHAHLLEVECWLHPRTVHRRHHVRCFDHVLGSIERPGLQRWAQWIRPEQFAGRNVAELHIDSETFRATEFGGDDVRDLGVNVLWLRLSRQGATVDDGGGEDVCAVHGAVPADGLEGAALRHGRGRVWVSRRRPWTSFLALFEAVARAHAPCLAPWFDAAAPPGVRGTVFPTRLLLWNRTSRAVEVQAPDGARSLEAWALRSWNRHP